MNVLKAIILFTTFSTIAIADESQRINFNEYSKKIKSLTSVCSKKNMDAFNGFCLSQKYEKQTITSITVALQLLGYENFYKKCEHSDLSDRNDLLIQSLNIENTKQFYEEMKTQTEAIENYSNHFDFCKSKNQNDLTASNKLKWFEYMLDKNLNYVKDENSGLHLVKKSAADRTINIIEILNVTYASSPEITSKPSIKTNSIEKSGVILKNGIYQSPFHGFQLKVPSVANSTQIRVIQSIISSRPDGSAITSDVIFLPNDSYGASALVVTRLRDDRPKDTESILAKFTPLNENELEKAKQQGVTYKRIDTTYGTTLQRTIKNRRITPYFPYQFAVDNSETTSSVGVSRFVVTNDFLLEFITITDSRHVNDIAKLDSAAETELDTLMKSLIKLPQLPHISL